MLLNPQPAGETVEPHAEPQKAWSPLQFGRPALTPLTIPDGHLAVRDGVAELFMRDYSYLVDFATHSALCVEALNGGFIQEADLVPLKERVDGYALHAVTRKVIDAIQLRVRFIANEVVPNSEAKAIYLARPFTDIQYAARVALAVTEAGLLHDSALTPIVEGGPDCGFELLAAAAKALDDLWPDAQREERNKDKEDVYRSTPFHTHVEGDFFCFTASERNQFYFDWPEVNDEFLEIHILLCKTLDAMSIYLVPFHTPCSAYGPWAQYSYHASETFDRQRDHVVGKSVEEITEHLMKIENFDEDDWLGMELEESGGDEEVIEKAARLMWEMADIEKNFTYLLDRSDDVQVRKQEMIELRAQLKDLLGSVTPYIELCKVLDDALANCLERVDTHRTISDMLGGEVHDGQGFEFEDSPDRFFDCIWVMAGDRHHQAMVDGLDAFNSEIQECEIAVRLPLESGELVAQVTKPIIERTNQCLALLRRIQLALEVADNA